MGFVVLPALPADICAVYNVYFAAFKDNAITRALFPSATAEELTDQESEFRYFHHPDPHLKKSFLHLEKGLLILSQ